MANLGKRTKRIGHNINERIAQEQKSFSLSSTLAVHRVQPRTTPAIILKSQRISISGQSKRANSSEFHPKSTLWCHLGTVKQWKNSKRLKTFLQELMSKWAIMIKAQRWSKKHLKLTIRTKAKASRLASSRLIPIKLEHPSWRIAGS